MAAERKTLANLLDQVEHMGLFGDSESVEQVRARLGTEQLSQPVQVLLKMLEVASAPGFFLQIQFHEAYSFTHPSAFLCSFTTYLPAATEREMEALSLAWHMENDAGISRAKVEQLPEFPQREGGE